MYARASVWERRIEKRDEGRQEGDLSNSAIYPLNPLLLPRPSTSSISRSEFAECPRLEPVHPVF